VRSKTGKTKEVCKHMFDEFLRSSCGKVWRELVWLRPECLRHEIRTENNMYSVQQCGDSYLGK